MNPIATRSLLALGLCTVAWAFGCSQKPRDVVQIDDPLQQLTFSEDQRQEFDHLQSLIAGLIDDDWVAIPLHKVRRNRLGSSLTLPAKNAGQSDPQRQFKLRIQHANSKVYEIGLEARRAAAAGEDWNVYVGFRQTYHFDAHQRWLYISCRSNSNPQDEITIWTLRGPEFHHSYEFGGLHHYVSASAEGNQEMATATARMHRMAASAESLRQFMLDQIEELQRIAEAKISSLEAFDCYREESFAGPHGEEEIEVIQLEPRVGEAELKQVLADLKQFTAEQRAMINRHHEQLYVAIMKTLPIDQLAVESISETVANSPAE